LKELQREKIWDPVTRLWHWVLAFAVALNWTFGTYMSFDTVKWHFYTGYLILGLMAFRILWGFIGPAPIRFASFIPTPASLLQYLKTVQPARRIVRHRHAGGHNGAGMHRIVHRNGRFLRIRPTQRLRVREDSRFHERVASLSLRRDFDSGDIACGCNCFLSAMEKGKFDQAHDQRLEMGAAQLMNKHWRA
jgi:hypothetical protein